MSNDVFAGFDRGPTDPDTLTMSSFDSDSSSSDRPNRMNKFSKALQAAAAYKKKRQAENEADAEVGKNGEIVTGKLIHSIRSISIQTTSFTIRICFWTTWNSFKKIFCLFIGSVNWYHDYSV